MTKRQAGFIRELLAQPLNDRNPRKAAIAAGYKPAHAGLAAARLMAREDVRLELLEQTTEEVRVITTLSVVDKAWMLREAYDLWETPLADLFDENGDIKKIQDMSHNVQKLIAGFKARRVLERTGEFDEDGRPVMEPVEIIEFKLVDRMRLLKMIGDHTDVNAFGGKEAAEAKGEFAKLMGALARSAERGEPIDVTQLGVNP